MGSSGGKSAPQDNSMALYQQQQADLARQKAEQEEKERKQQEAEQARREQLRKQMLGEAVSTDDEEGENLGGGDMAIQKNVLS